jgi:uncharacterized protein YgbK (DUF1537 family)
VCERSHFGAAMIVMQRPLSRPTATPQLADLLAHDDRRVFVLDDDPTGTQTVADVDVILRPDRRLFDESAKSSARSVFVLTNSRALAVDESVKLLGRVRQDITAAAAAAGVRAAFLLRGDSTLRGHVFAELDVFGGSGQVVLFVPAFPEGGRVTRWGVQWVRVDGRLRNAADTEYAADPVYGYQSRDLRSWVAETGNGRQALLVPLAELRRSGSRAVSSVLSMAPPGTVVIPDAASHRDLELVACGLLEAEAGGCQVVVRSASSFAAIRSGLEARAVSSVTLAAPGRLLVVCGSTTRSSTEQLSRLAAAGLEIQTLDAHQNSSMRRSLKARLDHDGVVVLATPRIRSPHMQDLASGAKVMKSLVDVVGSLQGDFEGVIAKGGVTSGEIAIGLGAETARVEGQLAAGIALWTLRLSGSWTMPYGVVPGNVGVPDTLLRVVNQFDHRKRPHSRRRDPE